MVYHHFDAPALLWVLQKALIDEILEVGGPMWRDARRLALNYIQEYASLLLRDVRRFALGQLYRENAQRPDVHLACVTVSTLDQFRRHPADSTYFAFTNLLLLRQHNSVPKVRQFYLPVAPDEDVV